MNIHFRQRYSGSIRPCPPARRNTSSDSRAFSAFAGASFFGSHFEGLGDIWNSLFPGGIDQYSREEQKILAESSPLGPALGRKNGGGTVASYASSPECGIAFHSHILFGEVGAAPSLIGGYPVFKGVPLSLRIEQSHIWSGKISGAVSAEDVRFHIPLNFFLGDFFRKIPCLERGRQIKVNLAALALDAYRAEDVERPLEPGTAAYESMLDRFLERNPYASEKEFVPPEGDTHGRGFISPTEYVGFWLFQMPALDVERVRFRGRRMFIIHTVLYGNEAEGIPLTLYIADHVLKGYRPDKGDDIAGALWLTGQLAD